MEQKFDSAKNAARIAGVLFLVQMITASISHAAILDPLLYGDNFLEAISVNSGMVRLGLLLDLACGASVFGIGVILFPILKKHSEPIALWHLGLRLNEWVMLTISGIFLLTLLAISRDYVSADMPKHAYLQELGNYMLKARGYTKILMLLGFCLSASMFYYLVFKSKLLPRFISIWGLIGVLLLSVEIFSNIYGHSVGGIMIMLPLGLNEIFLGIWLIVKGFNPSAINPGNTNDNT